MSVDENLFVLSCKFVKLVGCKTNLRRVVNFISVDRIEFLFMPNGKFIDRKKSYRMFLKMESGFKYDFEKVKEIYF
jgi:hypothetical protein